MVEKGATVDLPDPEGVTPLLWAIWNTRFDVAKYLIEHGANVNRWDWWGRTPLYLAVDYVTLPHGGRPDQPSLDETLPIDIVRLLLDKGADPNPQLKMTAPLRATGNDRGLDPMLAPGTTPLIRAAKAMDVESMKALLEHGADISLTNSRNMTATLAASGMGSTDADTRGYFTTSDVQDRAIAALDLMFGARRPGSSMARPASSPRSRCTAPHSGAGIAWSNTCCRRARTSTLPTAAATPPSITRWAGPAATAAAASASTFTRTRPTC